MAGKKKEEDSSTGFDFSALKKMVNKKAGENVAFNLKEDDNPTEVKEWISTGSSWLDRIICSGVVNAGIPIGKISSLAGEPASGKSYIASQIAGNAQRKNGLKVVLLESESAIDPGFVEAMGVDLDGLLYIQAQSVEFVLETIEDILKSTNERILFIWDSVAATPTISDVEGDFNPNSSVGVKARVLSKGLAKLTMPLANKQCTLLVLNQLKTNIPGKGRQHEALIEPFVTPGGKAINYHASLRIWLTKRKSKAAFVEDENGFRIGSEVKVRLKKSRFGSEGRQCTFQILWGGDELGIMDEESWMEAIRTSKYYTPGAWCKLEYADGEVQQFRKSDWKMHLQDEKFRARVLELMDEEVVHKFKNREGSASAFYDIDGVEEAGDKEEENDNT